MARNWLLIASVFIIGFFVLLPQPSSASVQNASSVTYLDSANNIIGHQYITCRNYTAHAGVLSSNYTVIQSWSCYETCYWDSTIGTNICDGGGQNTYYKNVQYINLSNGFTAKQFCENQNLFPGTLSCDAEGPEQLVGTGLVYSQGYP